jgi:hypothetical protein
MSQACFWAVARAAQRHGYQKELIGRVGDVLGGQLPGKMCFALACIWIMLKHHQELPDADNDVKFTEAYGKTMHGIP